MSKWEGERLNFIFWTLSLNRKCYNNLGIDEKLIAIAKVAYSFDPNSSGLIWGWLITTKAIESTHFRFVFNRSSLAHFWNSNGSHFCELHQTRLSRTPPSCQQYAVPMGGSTTSKIINRKTSFPRYASQATELAACHSLHGLANGQT